MTRPDSIQSGTVTPPFKRGCVVGLLILASACGSNSTTSPTPTPTATKFSLTGQVAESTPTTIKAIPGATVTIVDGPNAGKSATTDGSGNYNLTGLQPSGFTVNVSANNYVSQSSGVTLTSNQTLSFRLNRATSTVQPMAFELTGTATDDDGQPVANANLTVEFLVSDAPYTRFSDVSGVTDGAGFYRIDFTAAPGVMHGPPGTSAALALSYFSKLGYESDVRYVLGTTHDVSQSVHLYRIRRITAGESTVVTVAQDDTICDNNTQDYHPWPQEFVCRKVRVVAPSDGVMTFEAVSTLGGARPPLEVEIVGGYYCCSLRNPMSIQVTAGTELVVSVEMPFGSTTSQSFTLNTSMAQK
jgi:Carboxypeptidase regulatory-like domain